MPEWGMPWPTNHKQVVLGDCLDSNESPPRRHNAAMRRPVSRDHHSMLPCFPPSHQKYTRDRLPSHLPAFSNSFFSYTTFTRPAQSIQTMATSSTQVTLSVGILSIGEMGMGVARLLRHHDHTVYTVATGRRQVSSTPSYSSSPPRTADIELLTELPSPFSQHTLDRIKSSQIVALDSDEQLVAEADVILSIVPPRDAVATAKRVLDACRSQSAIKRRSERKGTAAATSNAPSLTYLDLNAVSPKTARSIAAMFSSPMSPAVRRRSSIARTFSFSQRKDPEPELEPIPVKFLDGGIIGGPPALQPDQSWRKPSLVVSGPRATDLLTPSLIEVTNMKILGAKVGQASALKSCFASLTKGMTALSILSFTTAHTCGVLKELQEHLAEFSPKTLDLAKGGLVSMPPKAYRWVEEMRQIGETFSEEGGFSSDVMAANGTGSNGTPHQGPNNLLSSNGGVFNGVADIYRLIADDTILGEERVEKRKRGTDPEDVAECIRDGIVRKKKKLAGEGKDLEAAWRGNWGA
jgi:3-hydroxyisobutyrate dehydrogenase-like beta-hydroxyacid dehydrogenase